MFNEATQNNYKISFDQCYTERGIISDLLVQNDIGSAQSVNSPKYLNAAHQTSLRTTTPDKKNNIVIFDNLDLRKSYVELDGQRYPRDGVLINYEENDYIQQYNDIKLLFHDYIGERLLQPVVSYPDIRTKYPIDIIDLRRQSDHITPRKIQFFLNYSTDPDNARLFLIIIRRREIKLISDGNKQLEVKVF